MRAACNQDEYLPTREAECSSVEPLGRVDRLPNSAGSARSVFDGSSSMTYMVVKVKGRGASRGDGVGRREDRWNDK